MATHDLPRPRPPISVPPGRGPATHPCQDTAPLASCHSERRARARAKREEGAGGTHAPSRHHQRALCIAPPITSALAHTPPSVVGHEPPHAGAPRGDAAAAAAGALRLRAGLLPRRARRLSRARRGRWRGAGRPVPAAAAPAGGGRREPVLLRGVVRAHLLRVQLPDGRAAAPAGLRRLRRDPRPAAAGPPAAAAGAPPPQQLPRRPPLPPHGRPSRQWRDGPHERRGDGEQLLAQRRRDGAAEEAELAVELLQAAAAAGHDAAHLRDGDGHAHADADAHADAAGRRRGERRHRQRRLQRPLQDLLHELLGRHQLQLHHVLRARRQEGQGARRRRRRHGHQLQQHRLSVWPVELVSGDDRHGRLHADAAGLRRLQSSRQARLRHSPAEHRREGKKNKDQQEAEEASRPRAQHGQAN